MLQKTSLVLCFFALSLTALAEEKVKNSSAKDLYQKGIQSFQAENLEKAKKYFLVAKEKSPENHHILHNLALTDYKLGNYGLALAYWRNAFNLNPDFSAAWDGIQLAKDELEGGWPVSDLSAWESLRSRFLQFFTLNEFLLLTLILFGSSGWLTLTYLGQRKRALRAEQPRPGPPYIAVTLGVLLGVSLTFTVIKFLQEGTPRATVIKETIELKSGPSAKASSLFELTTGMEVVVRSSANGWLQVSYPGSMTGWVKKDSVYITSGNPSW